MVIIMCFGLQVNSGVMKNGMHRDRRRQTDSFADAVGTPGMFPYNSIMFLNNTTKSSKYSIQILAHVTEYLEHLSHYYY